MDNNKKNNQTAIDAEAALWCVRLHAGTDETKAAFGRWISASPEHVTAYARAHEVWSALGPAIELPADAETHAPQPPAANNNIDRRGFIRLAALAAAVALAVLTGSYVLLAPKTWQTARGEQRTIALSDGTRVILNTDTRLRLRYTSGYRRIELAHGEALFKVAHDAERPFIVMAGNEQIRALGTEFVVRRNSDDTEVTLLSGRVEVSDRENKSRTITLSPGERLRQDAQGAPQLDTPRIEVVTAWRHGKLILENTLVTEAIAEMNRYSAKPLVLRPEAAQSLTGMRLNGVFHVAETHAFAQTISSMYHLELQESPTARTLR